MQLNNVQVRPLPSTSKTWRGTPIMAGVMTKTTKWLKYFGKLSNDSMKTKDESYWNSSQVVPDLRCSASKIYFRCSAFRMQVARTDSRRHPLVWTYWNCLKSKTWTLCSKSSGMPSILVQDLSSANLRLVFYSIKINSCFTYHFLPLYSTISTL